MAHTIKTIINTFTNAFKKAKTPATAIAAPLISAGVKFRPGLLASDVAARVVSRQAETGAISGNNMDGSQNISEMMEFIRVEEIVKAILTEAKITIVIPPGGLSVISNGANTGGPVVSNGSNITFIIGEGIIS